MDESLSLAGSIVGVLIGIALWVYYLAMVLIIGTMLTAIFEGRPEGSEED